MSKIRILSEKVANQIAAGEVIERPASVVRELLDNSIDAGADNIHVRIEKGGKSLIKLRDNGAGMDRDDLLLSLERHSTSKIRTVTDLFSINTLGFRGEALPSIASVSRIEITSRPPERLSGYRLKAAGGDLLSIDEAGAPVGTTVEVRDLFFNTPARRKFMKADATETAHIVDTLSRIVLPFTRIRLRLDDGERTLLHLPASENQLNRLSALLGRDVALSLMDSFFEKDGLNLRAYLAPPDLSRARGDRLYIYINKRSIRDRVIFRSVMEGYGQRLMKGRYPQGLVFLDIDPSTVDINVHPAKQEVRFHQSSLIYRTISSVIEKALKDQLTPFSKVGYRVAPHQEKESPGSIPIGVSMGVPMAEPAWVYHDEGQRVGGRNQDLSKAEGQYAMKDTPRLIGQLKDTYLLFQTMDGLLLVDQHAAHERIVYENLKRAYLGSKIESQTLLIPRTFELSLKEGRVVMEKLAQLSALGFELEPFGGTTFLLRAIPSVLIDRDWENFLLDLIPVLEEERSLSSEKALDKILTVISCHGAIRAGKKMSPPEMTLLIEQLEKMDLPTNCPHGRPIYKQFSYDEIEKMFKRIV